jgi:hypothetical protein
VEDGIAMNGTVVKCIAMRLYYMTSHEIATRYILPERRMKLSLFNELNDPFELQPYSLSDKALRKLNGALKDDVTTSRGLICFTESWRSPVMWAHYADKHRGICLGFDIAQGDTSGLVSPVVYNIDRLQFELDQEQPLYGINEEFVRALIYTKSKEWAYEREWRVMANLEDQDPISKHYYVDFGPQLQLREVILGARNDSPVGQVAKLTRGNASPVKVLKARAAFHEFTMVENLSIQPIRVPAN